VSRGSQCRLSEAEQAQVLAWSLERIALREQAVRLGKKPTSLVATVRRYQAEGLLPKRGKGPGQSWSAADIDQLHTLIDKGFGYDHIARKLGRTRTAVLLKAKRISYRLTHTRAALSARDAAGVLGLSCSKTVARWIGGYGLKARNAGTRDRPLWRIQWEDLLAWLEDRDHWMAYDPMRCVDLCLREHLVEIRETQPGRWLTPGEVGQRYCVTFEAVKQWVAKGFIPATRYGNWWIWDGDLVDFVPPCDRSKAGIPRAARRIVVGPDRIVAGPLVRREAA
jgi:hypothetical protein